MYQLIRSLLFKLDPELAHEITLDLLAAGHRLGLSSLFAEHVESESVEVMGLTFPNAVGLAAGLDKNAQAFAALGAMGFGFVEVGTVTPKAQAGNSKPRLFRLPEHEAIINRMGFNNNGVAAMVKRLQHHSYKGVLGVNIGKNLTTSVEEAVQDYLYCLDAVMPYADYVTANVSSPNTPGLRNLQFGDSLIELVAPLVEAKKRFADETGKHVPLAVKISPDMETDEIKLVADSLHKLGVDGIIATNTTLSRNGVEDHPLAKEAGGVSGVPVKEMSTQVVHTLATHLQGELPIIGVGGIASGEDAIEKLQAGASLVQIYSGFIYQGPDLIREAILHTSGFLREKQD